MGGAVGQTIGFETGFEANQPVTDVTTDNNTVTLSVGDGPGGNEQPVVAAVGEPREAFGPADAAGSSFQDQLGSFFLTDGTIESAPFFARDYSLSFERPVEGVQLDLLDFRADDGASPGDTVQLVAYSDRFDTRVGVDSFEVSEGLADPNRETLTVDEPSEPIRSAALVFEGEGDTGTAIDNIGFTQDDGSSDTGSGWSIEPVDADRPEGDFAPPFTFEITRPDTGEGAFANLDFAGSGDTPADSEDFSSQFLGVSFAPDEVTQTITAKVAGDTEPEPDEEFTVTMTDGDGNLLDTATGVIRNDDGEVPAGDNGAPIAEPDMANAEAGGATTIDVLANDVDPDGDPLTVKIEVQPDIGEASVDGQAIDYELPEGVPQDDSTAMFSYTASDGNGSSDTAQVTMDIEGPGTLDPGDTVDPNIVALNGAEQTLRVPFNADVRGTAAAETVQAPAGADLGFAIGDGDRVEFAGALADYSLSQAGNQVIVDNGATHAEISLNADGDLAFAGGSATASIGLGADGVEITLGGETLGPDFDPGAVQLDANDPSGLPANTPTSSLLADSVDFA